MAMYILSIFNVANHYQIDCTLCSCFTTSSTLNSFFLILFPIFTEIIKVISEELTKLAVKESQ